MGSHSRSSSSAFASGLLIPSLVILLCTSLQCSGARPLPAQFKAPLMEINNHRQYDDQHINEPLHPVQGKSAFKPVFAMLPKGPVPPSGPSPITNSSPNADSTQISTRSVSDQP